MKKEDLDYIASLEKAISKKYGAEAIQNPKADWTEEKEKEYLEQIKSLGKKENKIQQKNSKVEINGFFVPKKLLIKDSKRRCPVCDVYSFDIKDDVYMSKFECCFGCYVQWVEGREKRWQTGWRPNKEE